MKELPLGTIRGEDSSGQTQSFSVNKAGDKYIVINAKLERRTMAAKSIDDLLAESAAVFCVERVEFIPAHGALGAKGPEVHAAEGTPQSDK